MAKLFEEMFGVDRPVIGMAHFKPLPGNPKYDEGGRIDSIFDAILYDVQKLCEGGVNGILFCNEGDIPYQTKIEFEVVACMSSLIGRIKKEIKVPFGVDVMWNPKAALAIAKATGAIFVRGLFTGCYAGDAGIVSGDPGILRYKRNIDAQNVKLFNLIPAEFAGSLDNRPIEIKAKTAVFVGAADAVCISGPMTGMENIDDLEKVKKYLPSVPILANTGVTAENVYQKLQVADGAVIGTYFKVNGNPWNPIDIDRVKKLLKEARRRE